MCAHLIHGSLGLTSPKPKLRLERFGRYAWLGWFPLVTDRQTDRQTLDATCVAIDRI